MVKFHNDFLERMKILLKNDYCKFLESLNEDPVVGIRVNTLLVRDVYGLISQLPFKVQKLDFFENGFKLLEKYDGLGRLAFHHAGAFYIQDVSAMSTVCVLDPKPGDMVLDLCAAPGGKSTQIAACLGGKGFIFSNEVIKSRAKTLISNFERMGVENAIVFSKMPDELVLDYYQYFDKVLVDAPCSGEGMFRKNPKAIYQWSAEHSRGCAVRQKEIINTAALMVRPGGVLVYSTCTFSVDENEEIIRDFLRENIDFVLEPIKISIGSPSKCDNILPYAEYVRRIYPYHGGEGHFIARLKRKGCLKVDYSLFDDFVKIDLFNEFWKQTFNEPIPKIAKFGDKIMIIPKNMPNVNGAMRTGVLAGRIKNNRFIPEHHLFKCNINVREDKVLNLLPDDEMLNKFLKGEEIPCGLKGYCMVKVCGVPLGFGKASNGRLKNHYPKGLRQI